MEIEEMYKHLHSAASGVVKTGECHRPILVTLFEDDEMDITSMEDLPKAVVAEAQRLMVQMPGVVASVLIMEAWVANMLETDVELVRKVQQGVLQVSDCPNRGEAIIFNILTPTRQAMVQCMIDRETATLEQSPLRWMDEQPGTVYRGKFVRG